MFGLQPWRDRQKLSLFGNDLLKRSQAGGISELKVRLRSQQTFHVGLSRKKSRINLDVGHELFEESRRHVLEARLPVLIHLFGRADHAVRAPAYVGDTSSHRRNEILFSADHDQALLVPDPDFFNTCGYETRRIAVPNLPDWTHRSSDILWRGSTTGWASEGNKSEAGDRMTTQRVRFCLALRRTPGIDAKIYAIVQSDQPDEDRESLTSEGLLGEMIPEIEWGKRRFAFDIDGNCNAWSNLFVRLLFGCCVIKIASPKGFRQWYYDRLKPNVHYVSVQADLSDLHQRIDWCLSHPDDCRAIAAEGQRLAMSLTFESEMAAAATQISRRFRSPAWAGF